MSDGKRRLMSVSEITGMEGQVLQMQEIFAFHRTHTDADGTVHGEFHATGTPPPLHGRHAAAEASPTTPPTSIRNAGWGRPVPQFDLDPNLVFEILIFAAVFSAVQAAWGLLRVGRGQATREPAADRRYRTGLAIWARW